MKVEYFSRNGISMFTLNGNPMTQEERKRYAKLCDEAVKRYRENGKHADPSNPMER